MASANLLSGLPPLHPEARRIFEALPSLAVLLTPDFRIAAVTPAYAEAAMRTSESLLGRHIFDAFPDNPARLSESPIALVRASLERARDSRRMDHMRLQRYDIRRPGEEGEFEERYWSPATVPVLDERGEVEYLIHRVEDVTHLVKGGLMMEDEGNQHESRALLALGEVEAVRRLLESEQIARREERLFRAAFAHASVGMAVTTIDRRILRANDAFCRMLGYQERELKQMEVFDITHPEDRPLNRTLIDGLLQGERGNYDLEKRYIRKDGSIVWVRVVVSLMHDDNDHAESLVALATDITAQREAEQQLRATQHQVQEQLRELEALYSTAPVGLAMLSVNDYRFLRCNAFQAELMGLKVEDTVNRTCWDVAPALMPILDPLLRQVADTGVPVRNFLLTGELITAPGVERQWHVDYVPVFGADGAVAGIACVTLDVTEQRQAEATLRNSEKLAATGRLAATIAHEINNPLESVTNLIYLACLDRSLSEGTRKQLEMADQELSRVTHIAQQTLGFYRDTAGPVFVDIPQLLQDVLSLYERRMSYKRIEVRDKTAPMKLHCLQGELRQVISNLVANAIDASPERGAVYVRAHPSRDWRTGKTVLRAIVADNGTGIAPATRSTLFKPFFTTKKEVGNGLGLWVSRGMLEKHGGTIRLRTRTTQPTGTVFMITLPETPGAIA